MIDDLDRIERIYGCVAEYNRCMYEESDLNDLDPRDVDDFPYPFVVGQKFTVTEFDGGITIYGISKINKDRTKLLATETWINVDGTGKRRPRWHKIINDTYGDEKFQINPQDDSWVCAKEAYKGGE